MSAKTSTIGSKGNNIKADVKRAGKKAEYSPLVEDMTRLGYGVRGLIYIRLLIGFKELSK